MYAIRSYYDHAHGHVARIRDVGPAEHLRLWVAEHVLDFHVGVLGIAAQVQDLGFVTVQLAQREVLLGIRVGRNNFV